MFIVICFDGIVSTFILLLFSLFLLKTKNQNNQVAKMAVNGNFNDCINSFLMKFKLLSKTFYKIAIEII